MFHCDKSAVSERLNRRTILWTYECAILHYIVLHNFLAFRDSPIIPLRRSPSNSRCAPTAECGRAGSSGRCTRSRRRRPPWWTRTWATGPAAVESRADLEKNFTLSLTIIQGRSNWILHRKLKYSICSVRDTVCHTKNRKRSLKQHIEYFNFRSKIQLDHPVQRLSTYSISVPTICVWIWVL